MIFSQSSMQDRTIVVTGASSGLGRETAKLLGRCGARVILSGRDEKRLSATAATFREGYAIVHPVDLQTADDTSGFLKSLSQDCGAFDGIVHAAGVELVRPMRLTNQEQIDHVFRASVYGSLGVARAAGMKSVFSETASIVFISSAAGVLGTPGMAAYSAAKAAVDGLVRSLAGEIAPRRVNSIVAGAVTTEMHERLSQMLGKDGVENYRARHPLGFGDPTDIASAAMFLLSDAARWITGSSLVVDGGYTAVK